MTTAALVPNDARRWVIQEAGEYHEMVATIAYLRDLEARQVDVPALLAQVAALRAENARLRAYITRGHAWRKDGREHVCRRCGLRALHPLRVEYSCREWRERSGDGRKEARLRIREIAPDAL